MNDMSNPITTILATYVEEIFPFFKAGEGIIYFLPNPLYCASDVMERNNVEHFLRNFANPTSPPTERKIIFTFHDDHLRQTIVASGV